MSDQKKKTIAKALFSEHSLGEGLLKGWWAQPSPDPKSPGILVHRYIESRKISSSQVFQIGEETRGGRLSLDTKNGLVTVGDHCLPYFDVIDSNLELLPGYARKIATRKGEPKKFMADTDGKRIPLIEGEKANGLGMVTVLDSGHIKLDGKIIPVAPKVFEIMLLAQDKSEAGGYLAYMNLKQPGSSRNMKNGIQGVYYPSKGEKPANFSERGADGEFYQTAKFWSTESSSSKALPNEAQKSQLADRMVSFGVKLVDAISDINDACKNAGATYNSLLKNIEYCEKKSKNAIKNSLSEIRPGYVRKAVKEGFVPHGPEQGKYSNVQVRPIEVANKEKEIYREKEALLKKELTIEEDLRLSGIDGVEFSDHPLYDRNDAPRVKELEKNLQEIQSNGWKNYLFTFLQGENTMHRERKKESKKEHKNESKGP
jgi:hypothetical protein